MCPAVLAFLQKSWSSCHKLPDVSFLFFHKIIVSELSDKPDIAQEVCRARTLVPGLVLGSVQSGN